jgi:multicomponent Na+:H+ antiporter subunit D
MLFSSVVMAIAIIGMGLWAAPIVDYCQLAAEDLLTPSKYIDYVLGYN